MANTLFLRLEGPMQSWGERGRWSERDSAPEPTKSGVVGLVACALGYRHDDQLRHLSEQTRMGVRCDAPGVRLTDYHTIGGGYPFPTLLEATGKPKKTPKGAPHTEISWRDYLCGASFLVALLSEKNDLIERMAHALQNPVWPVFLGRKSCPPSRPVYDGIATFASLEDALRAGHWSDTIPMPPETVRVRAVIECESAQGIRRRDHILSRSRRVFGPRYTRDFFLEINLSAKLAATQREET